MKTWNVGRLDDWKVGMLTVWTLSNTPTFQLSAQEPFPTRPPAPVRLRPVQFPPFREVALPNGMTLLLVENHEQPTLSVSLSFRAGSAYDPAGKEGVAAIVAELLTKGTPTQNAEQIAAAIEGVGGSIGASAGDDFLAVSADVLSDHAELAFSLLGDVSRRATLAFGGGRGTAPPAPAFPAPPAKRGTDILLVNRPGSVQTNIVIGNTTFLSTDTTYYAARIATHVLGGGSDSRLFIILREQKSWTYGSYAALRRNRGVGFWQATFEGRTEVTDRALTELLHQIDRIRTEAIPDSD